MYNILEKLISFNTIGDKENLLLMDYVGNILKEKGFEIKYLFNNDQTKKCLVATYQDPNLLFIGHTDTVDYSNWDYDPFKLTIIDNKIYGLGTCDMKGNIYAFLEALNRIDLNDLNKGLEVILTFDEERDFGGIKLICENDVFIPNNVIVGEPTSLIPVSNTKGCMEFKIDFKGITAHSSCVNKGDNAILKAMYFTKELLNFYKGLKEDKNPLFEIPYTTLNISKIDGGKNINSVPDNCELTFDFRTIKKEHHELIINFLELLCNKYKAKLTKITNLYPLENNSDLSFYENLTGNKKKSFNFVTEASFLDKDNVVILGVGPNNEHQRNEYIDVDSLNSLINYYVEIINKYCEKKDKLY